jgi:hypothetical protein
VLAVLTTLFAAAPAQAAIPHSEITLFSDFGHDLVDGSEWRWTSDDEDLDAYVEDNRMTVEIGPKFDAEIKHWFTHVSPPGTQLEPGVYRVPNSYPLSGVPGKPSMHITATYGSLALTCPYHSSGAFEVRELAYGADGKITRAWILFEQRCNREAPGAFGEIRIGMPRPSAAAMTACPNPCASW